MQIKIEGFLSAPLTISRTLNRLPITQAEATCKSFYGMHQKLDVLDL